MLNCGGGAIASYLNEILEMSNILNSQSITDELNECTSPTKSILRHQQQQQQQDAANGNNSNDIDSNIEVETHDNLTCRMPRRAADDADNGDDSESDVIIVSDTSETSSIVSYINPSDLDKDSDDNNDICKASTIPETESENDSYIDDDEELSDDSSMENFVNAFKLKFESFLSGGEPCDQGKGDVDTHDNLTCRMHQRAADDGDNGDVFDSEDIIVADTSDIFKASTIPEAERENDSYIDVEKLSDDSMMENLESAAIKLKIELFSNGSEKPKATESGDQGKGDIDSNIDDDTHENLTGRMPQRAADDADNGDDTESDVIIVSDTSETSSIVSYINPSDLDTDSDDNNDICKASTIPETESENDSYIDDDEEQSDDSTMEKFVSAFKLKFESFLSGGEPCDQGKGDVDTHDNLTCRMHQRAADDGDNGDVFDSEDIIVADTSDIFKASTIPEAERENDSYIDVEKLSDDSMMEKLVSAPISRKIETFSSGSEKTNAKKPSLELSLLKETPLDARKVLNTRSGRVLRQRIDHKVDKAQLEVDDDDTDDEDYVVKVRKKPTRKRRISALLSSDSNNSSSSIASFSMTHNADAVLIYVDLRQPVAIVSSEPTADATAVECDSELKMRLDKFLGLRPAQRRLFNPMANYEFEDNHMDEDSPPSSRLWAVHNTPPAVKEPRAQVAKATSTPIVKSLDANLTNEMKMLILDDIVKRTNANYFESQTPQHIKEPIDLSGLPSEEVRAINCQQHKDITNSLERYEGYSFVDSLRPETPFNMCHPLAVYYRTRDFESTKAGLAKTLFNVLNHSIFHCGLRRIITWKSCMNTPSAIVHSIKADGQRTSRIVLWKQMKQPIMLVKVLLHEMCHAAAFVYHGETGHGDHCRKWAYRAKSVIPELPQIDDCNAKFKYTCLLCRRRSHGIIKFEDEEQQLRCHYCQFEVNVEKFNAEEVHALSFIDHLVTPYKQFVRENYLNCAESTHSSKMQSLNSQYKDQLQQY